MKTLLIFAAIAVGGYYLLGDEPDYVPVAQSAEDAFHHMSCDGYALDENKNLVKVREYSEEYSRECYRQQR